MPENKTPTLAELNRHLFAELLPDTHALDKVAEKPKLTKAQEKAAAKAAAEAPQYTAEQLEVLKAAGIDDPAAADPQTVAALLGQ